MVLKKADEAGRPARRWWLFGAADRGAPEGTGRARSALIILGIATAIVVGGWLGFRKLWSYVINLDEFRVYPGQVELAKLPWLDGAAFQKDLLARDAQRLLSRDGRLLGYSIFTPDVTATAARAYEQSPWVRRTLLVRKAFPNRLHVQLDLRRPYAWVEYQGRPYILDEEGVWLDPRIYRVAPNWTGRAPIRLAQVEQQPVMGAAWSDPGVRLALDMVRYIEDNAAFFNQIGIRAIEVRKDGPLASLAKRLPAAAGLSTGAVASKNCTVLTTAAGTEIRWGCSPYAQTSPADAEVSAGAKMRALRGILQQQGPSALSGSAFEYIDLRWDRPTVKPAAGNKTAARAQA